MEAQEKRPQYMFLFPTTGYFAVAASFVLSKYPRKLWEIGTQILSKKLSDIIAARYRNAGYEVNWLMFIDDKDPYCTISPHMDIKPADRMINSGTVGFYKAYPNPDFVLDQLPPHDRLVLGGFHQFDCVDRIARRSHERGVKTFVDEDTTDLFFLRYARHKIPLIRTSWDTKELGLELFEGEAMQLRKGKPWFVQEDRSVPEFVVHKIA